MAQRTRRRTPLTTGHPAIKEYYALLEQYRQQRVRHEGAVSTAFENLLMQLSKERG